MIWIGTVGQYGKMVDQIFLYILTITLFFFLLITVLMVYFVIRYHRTRNPQPVDIEGNTWLEITWTVVPTLLVLTMFFYALTGFKFLKKAPEGAMEVKVIARQWSWLFEYSDGVKTTELTVPLNKPVKLLLSSRDVIHSFYIPAFRMKQDAVPGIETSLWFQADEAGDYEAFCAEYCGQQHSKMLTTVHVVPEEQFASWLESQKQPVLVAVSPERGKQLYQEKGCIACHTTDGSPLVGPTWKGIYGSTVKVFTNGKEREITVDDEYIRKSILNPNADVVAGFPENLMPPMEGQITDEEIQAIIEFIKSLK